MKPLPNCPSELPSDIGKILNTLGRMWRKSEIRPNIEPSVVARWNDLLEEWADDKSLPLLIRKGSLVRGSEIRHASGRMIVPCDNSPAQWACNLALREHVPSIAEIRKQFSDDSIPVSFAHRKTEKQARRYHCTLGKHTVNKNGWKLCHISSVGLNTRLALADVNLAELKAKFVTLLSPSNYFLLPMAWGGLGEAVEFIDGFQKRPDQQT